MIQQNEFKWTIIFLMKSLSAQVQDMVAVIDQLLAARKAKDIAIVLCINIDSNLVPSNFPRGTNRPPAGFTTLFYSIEFVQNSLTLISENPKFDILDGASVTFFFKDIVQDNFPAEQYALFTWDHGQPFGIFGGSDEAPLIVNSKNPLPLYFKLYNTFPALKHKARQFLTESDVQILTITELRNAIASSFSGKKIGVIAMSNCYLQFFDTGYELSSCAEYLVAFETLMYFADTFNYKTILEAISRNPYISSESLSRLIVSTFSYETDPNSSNEFKRSVALFANDLSWYPSIAKQFDELSKTLIRELPRYFLEIKTSLSKCGYIAPNIEIFALIDFRNFITCLYNEAPALFHNNGYEVIQWFLEKVVVESFVGEDFANEASDEFKAPSCFSIYLPKTPGIYHSLFRDLYMRESGLSPTEFVKRFSWDAFIARYIEMIEITSPEKTGI